MDLDINKSYNKIRYILINIIKAQLFFRH